ncbi:MAG TPA: hypothetical protein VKZ85_06130 [Woeseiaceae bacterium]|nr:hypothetical protein [Woeseiaceae bacterium]
MILLPAFASVTKADLSDGALFRETFKEFQPPWLTIDRHRKVLVYTTNGIDGRILQVTYIPSSQGSERVLQNYWLTSVVTAATLSFDMKLHSQFEFVRGGKLHGLMGGTATTGCQPIDPFGWSVRMMWMGANGTPVLYIYHQDRVSECGDVFYPSASFEWRKGRWYRIDLYVKMNSDVGSADGRATLYINGEPIVDVRHLNLSGSRLVQIDKFAFHTFYGGDDPSWSPSKNTYIYFDNFTVMPGKFVTGERGTTCEIFREGIYNLYTASCCAQSCGACGGPPCGGLPGGAAQCCTSQVSTNGRYCDLNGDSAPCSFLFSEYYNGGNPSQAGSGDTGQEVQ